MGRSLSRERPTVTYRLSPELVHTIDELRSARISEGHGARQARVRCGEGSRRTPSSRESEHAMIPADWIELDAKAYDFELVHETDDDRTFSSEALDELGGQMLSFVASRVVREWEYQGRAPRRLVVSVEIKELS